MSLHTGQRLENRYQIDTLLGQGGMGAVYRATDLRFNATVAIKENRMVTAESQKQFAREAGLLYRLRHPNLARVIDHFSIPQQGQYLVMDYIEGQDLKQIVSRDGAVAQTKALEWMHQVLGALEYLHSVNIIHRDVKPANVKITPLEQVYLVDFGLAKVYNPRQLTTVGARGVTPGYAPPEQYGQGRTDARSDIYSAAATLYALLTGHDPPDALECMTRQAQFPLPRELNPRISPHVEAAILQAMQVAPIDRFQTTTELSAALFEAPTRQMGVEEAGVQQRRTPAKEPRPAAAPSPAATPAAFQPVGEVPYRPRERASSEDSINVSGKPVSAESVSQPRPTNWKRIAVLALIAAVLGAVAAEVGFFSLILVVLGLLIYHARRVLQFHIWQYQVEVLGMWLSNAFGYALILQTVRGGSEHGLGVELTAIAVAFWLPSAIVGAVVLWLARRVALRKRV